MTLDEAIRHCEEVAVRNETQAKNIGGLLIGSAVDKYVTDCRECAEEHRQLAEWLTELKELREENKVLISECDRLIKEKGELLSKVSGGDVLRICQLEEQLEKAKELLKAATGIIKDVDCNEDYLCDECEYRAKCDGGFSFYWRYTDEALKLIGGRTDEEP